MWLISEGVQKMEARSLVDMVALDLQSVRMDFALGPLRDGNDPTADTSGTGASMDCY